MKNYDEFKEELLRRKNHRTALRRQRRARLVSVCTSIVLCITLLAILLLPSTGSVDILDPSNPLIPVAQAADLMAGIQSNKVTGKDADDTFRTSQLAFALELFQSCYTKGTDKNTLISPLSVMLALAMTANGANGQTKAEMEAVLGMPIEELNRYLYSYVNHLPSSDKNKVTIANSIWYRDQENRLQVKESFLQRNADYYNAAAYKAPFDDTTLQDINNWVNDKTYGMIEKILGQINPDSVMYLINALAFDAKWNTPYDDKSLWDSKFTNASGEKQAVTMMRSIEKCPYFYDDHAVGFMKYYENPRYAFVAILPNEGISVEDYVNSLTAESLASLLASREDVTVNSLLPKFSYEYDIQLSGILQSMGMSTAFDPIAADFSEMATSGNGNIFIGDVLHKTCITVDQEGTRAAAVTSVEMLDGAVSYDVFINLNRPFVYMILDTYNNLPLFIGTVMGVEN